MESMLTNVLTDLSVIHFLENNLGKKSIIIFGNEGTGKTELCRELIRSRNDLLFKFVDPYGEIFDGLNLQSGTNYDIYDPDLFDKNATVFIRNCQSDDISRLFEIMKYSAGVLTTFQASSLDEAVQCLILRARFEDSSRTIDEWKNFLAEIKPLFIQLELRGQEHYIVDIVDFNGTIKHIHPI